MSLFPKSQHLLVVGAGYAGLPFTIQMAKRLRKNHRKNLRLTLVNPDPQQELTCEFYRTLRNGARSSLPFLESLKKLGVEYKEARVVGIDPQRGEVALSGSKDKSLSYDHLVLATGTQPQIPAIEGLPELLSSSLDRVFVFKTQSQVQALRMGLRRLHWSANEKFDRDRFVVILGGGTTGIEVAGEIAALRERNPRARVVLVEQHGQLIPGESPVARRMLLSELRKRNIEFILGSPALKADSKEIELQNGQMIPWDLLVLCCGGTPQQSLLLTAFSSALDPHQGLRTDSKLEIIGSPHHYAIGDVSKTVRNTSSELANEIHSLKSAQSALRSAKYLARNLSERLRIEDGSGSEDYKNTELGLLLSLGPDFGIARLGSMPRSNLGRTLSPFIWGPRANELKRLNEIRYRKSIQWSRWV